MSLNSTPESSRPIPENNNVLELPLLRHRRFSSERRWLAEGSLKASIFNLTNATLGAGIVSVPYATMTLGIVMSVSTTIFLAFASLLATKALVHVLDYTQATSFESMAYLAAVGYLLCIGDIYCVVLEAFANQSPYHIEWWYSRQGVNAELGDLPYFKALWPRDPRAPLRGIPLFVFAFSCHSNAPSIYNELERQSYRRMTKVASRSVYVAFATYLIMGLCGFCIFGFEVEPNILSNFTSELKQSRLLLIAFIGILIGVLLSFPTNIFPCRTALEMGLFPYIQPTATASTIIAASLVIAALCCALVVPSLAVVFGITGSTCGACIAFIFPGTFVLSLLPGSLSDPIKVKALCLFIVGVCIALFGTAVSVAELMKASHSVI